MGKLTGIRSSWRSAKRTAREVLRWLWHGASPGDIRSFRRAKTESRIKANLEGDFKLDPEDVKKIEAVGGKLRFNDLSQSLGWNFYADLEGKKK